MLKPTRQLLGRVDGAAVIPWSASGDDSAGGGSSGGSADGIRRGDDVGLVLCDDLFLVVRRRKGVESLVNVILLEV